MSDSTPAHDSPAETSATDTIPSVPSQDALDAQTPPYAADAESAPDAPVASAPPSGTEQPAVAAEPDGPADVAGAAADEGDGDKVDGDQDGDEDIDEDIDEDTAEDGGEGGAGDESSKPAAPGKSRSGRVRQLEREGEVAADFLETLLDIADLDGDIDVDVDGDRAAIAIVDSEEGRVPRRLVGAEGKVLEALQELTRLAVQAETGERSRLMLDVAGHRAERRTVLVELAAKTIAEVKATGAKQSLEPMSAFERKVVHDEVAAAGLTSESEGVEPKRHIVILP